VNTQSLLLLGCGGFGNEVAAWITAHAMPFKVLGFLDDEKPTAPGVVGPIQDHTPQPDAKYLTCFGSGSARHQMRMQLQARGAHFATLVSPNAMTATPFTGVVNCIFLGACSISSGVTLNNDLLIQGFAVIGHDVTIGTGVTVSSHAFIGGGAKLEPFCTIHPHAVILPHVVVGEGAVVGAGTVVIKNVPPGATVFGMPARIIVPGKGA
jgi:sugar O-acyltransferase (sialic acid O-acetyltransferase NeuD family)